MPETHEQNFLQTIGAQGQPQSPPPVGKTVDPIASQPASQQQDEQTPVTYAGFWIRVLAAIIDGIILSVITGIVNGIFGGIFGLSAATSTLDPTATAAALTGLFGITFVLNLAIGYGYYVGLTGAKGATLGKMALGLKVVNADSQKIGYGKAALREILGKFVSGVIFGLGYLWVAFDPKKQGWHDKIAGTVVVKTR